MSLPVGIGLAGLGRWGRNYVKTLLGLPECRLVAAADPDPTAHAAVAALTGIAVLKSVDAMLSDPAVQAIIIATPDRTHFALAAAALSAGRDVLVEKPMTLTVAKSEALVEQAETADRVLAVGHTATYAADVESFKAILHASPQVRGRRIVAERTSSGPASGHSSFADRPSALLFDLCPHDIALASLLFGDPAAARAHPDGGGVVYDVQFQDGDMLSGKAEWREPPHVRRFELTGVGHTMDGRPGTPDCRDVRDTPLGLQCLDFIRSCQARRRPLSSGRLGLAVVRCLNALAASARDSGAWVSLRTEARAPNDRRRTDAPGLQTSDLGARA